MEEEYSFSGQREKEKVLLVLRRHPFVLAKVGVILIILFLLFLFIFSIFKFSWVFSWFGGGLILFSLWYGGRNWLCWYRSIYLITNQRILKVSQRSFFFKKISEIQLEQIEKVSSQVSSFWGAILNYGSVSLFSKGGNELIRLGEIENPYQIQQQIINLIKKLR